MIIRTLCNNCLQPFELSIGPDETHLLKDILDEETMQAPCPRICGGKILLDGSDVAAEVSKDRRLRDPMVITMKELYQAVHGAGLPDEIPKSPEVVSALLRSSPVIRDDVVSRHGRIYLDRLVLQNGAEIHLSCGAYGAVVTKITKEP